MVAIVTPRLILVSTPLQVICTRLTCDDFLADISVQDDVISGRGDETMRVRFPPEWPGEAVVMLPGWKAQLEADPQYEMLGGTMIDRADRIAVGQMNFRALPDEANALELGYGVNPQYQGRGYATEAAQGLVRWATAQPGIGRITSACLEENVASIRVLEKVGFRPIGHRIDDEGRSVLWEYGG
jgi:[ribosomal protein S5]-alanine N-acetyltransferase